MYQCQICNVEYKSRMGLYNHKKKYHPSEPKDKRHICSYCKKEFNHKQNKWRHEQTCKQREIVDDYTKMKNEIEKLKKKVHELSNKPVTNILQTINNISGNTYNNVTSNLINNNVTVVIPFGKEPLNCIPEAEVIKTLEECGINAITELCKTKHFNPNKPEHHNFCVTSKNDPYAIIVDPETKRPKSVNKKEVFDKAYYGIVMNIDSVKTQKPEVIETKDKIKAVSMSKNMIKHVRTAFNEEAYHNKDMVQNTWKTALFGNKDESNAHKPFEQTNQINYSKPKTRQELIKDFQDLLNDVKSNLEIDV